MGTILTASCAFTAGCIATWVITRTRAGRRRRRDEAAFWRYVRERRGLAQDAR